MQSYSTTKCTCFFYVTNEHTLLKLKITQLELISLTPSKKNASSHTYVDFYELNLASLHVCKICNLKLNVEGLKNVHYLLNGLVKTNWIN